MSENRNVPKLRFQEFRDKWNYNTLGEIAEIKTGPFGSTLHKEDYVIEGTPIITVEHLSDLGVVHKNLPLVSDLDKVRLKSYSLVEGDLVFSRVGSIDRCTLIRKPEHGWLFSGRLLRVRFKTNKSAFFNYFFQLERSKQKVRSVAVGQTMPSINTEILKGISVNYPSLPEQQKIASFITNVDQRVELLQAKKEKLEAYKKGVMKQIFTQQTRFKADDGSDFPDWEEKKLGEVLSIGSGRDYKHLGAGDIPVLGTGGLMGYVDDFLFNGESVGIGRKGTIDKPVFLTGKFWTVDTLFYTHSFRNVLPNFVYRIFLMINWKEHNEASGVPSLSKSTIERLKVQIPTMEEQKKIVQFLSSLDTSIQNFHQQINQTQTWKKGLLQKMFI